MLGADFVQLLDRELIPSAVTPDVKVFYYNLYVFCQHIHHPILICSFVKWRRNKHLLTAYCSHDSQERWSLSICCRDLSRPSSWWRCGKCCISLPGWHESCQCVTSSACSEIATGFEFLCSSAWNHWYEEEELLNCNPYETMIQPFHVWVIVYRWADLPQVML